MPFRALAVAVLLCSPPVVAQGLAVIPVPAVALDSEAPHFAYNGHPTTFKAIARGGNGTYQVEWDFEGDGTYDVTATATDRYDLSARFTYPAQVRDARFVARVRVTSNGETVSASYPVQVFADVPSTPATATARQLQVMRNVAIDDGLWYLHGQLVRSGNEADPVTGARATATIPVPPPSGSVNMDSLATAGFLEALGRNGRYVAFPAAYAGSMPDPAANAARWATDPYAEDALRLVNRLLENVTVVSVSAQDEANDTGFYPTVVRTPIAGTDDGLGLFCGNGQGDTGTGAHAATVRAFAVARLKGLVAQVGDANRVLGRPLEFILQQMVDALVWAQNDGGSYPGSWYYSPNGGADLLGEYGGGTMDCAEALWMAEQFAGAEGIIVPNLAKARLLSFIFQNANACPAGGTGGTWGTWSDNICDLALTAAHLGALGWAGANTLSPTDSRYAFPSHNGLSRGQLRRQFDSTLQFIDTTFLSGIPTSSIGWDLGFVPSGDFARTDGQGDLFAMHHWARAARSVEPEVVTFDANDWFRLFTTFLVANQATTGGWNWQLSLSAFNDQAVGERVRATWAVLVLSPDQALPVSVPSASASSVPEGTVVTLTGQGNVPGPVTYTWELGNGETRTGSPLAYAYPDDGTFSVTSTVTAAGGATASQGLSITVTNVAPTADAGADVTLDEGSSLEFRGSFVDPGTADTHTVSWSFGDGLGGAAAAMPHVYADDGTFTAVFTVTDDDLGTGTDSATITVRNVAPTITSSPPVVALPGAPLSYALTFVDPGTADTHTCSGPTVPAGTSWSGCTLTWTPTTAQLGGQSFSLCVEDNDGARACQAFQVIVVQPGSNLPPSAPRLDSPAPGARVASLQPTLVVQNAEDPEGDVLTYEFEVLQAGARVASQQGVPAGTGTTSWQVPSDLLEDESYAWRARAVAPGGPGPWSDLGQFRVNAVNAAPRPVVLLGPTGDALVHTLAPTLTFLPYPDADGDALAFDWEIGSDESFATVLESGSGVAATEVTPSVPLAEDARTCWRVRADDGQATSAWTQACFRVSAVDGPPSVVSHLGPGADAEVATTAPVFAWTPAVDPEGLPVTYELVVVEGTSSVATVATGGTATVLPVPLVDGRTYTWKVRPLTSSGPAGAFSAESAFSVRLPVEEEPPPASGCACTSAAGAEGVLLWGMLALLRRGRARAAR